MDSASDRLASAARLAGEQHRCGRGRCHVGLLAQSQGGKALAGDLGLSRQLFEQAPVVLLEPLSVQRVAQDQQRLLQRERLLDEIEGAQLGRPDRRVDGAVPRDHHHLGIRPPFADQLERLQAVHSRQPHVEQDRVVIAAIQFGQTVLGRRRARDAVALITEDAFQSRSHSRLVIDHQDPLFRHFPAS